MKRTIEPLLYTVPDLAEALRVSERTVQRQLAAGQIPGVLRLGRIRRIRVDTVREWIRAGVPAVREWEASRRGNVA